MLLACGGDTVLATYDFYRCDNRRNHPYRTQDAVVYTDALAGSASSEVGIPHDALAWCSPRWLPAPDVLDGSMHDDGMLDRGMLSLHYDIGDRE